METDNQVLLSAFAMGLGLAVLMHVWKKASLRWTHWVPLLKRGAELSLKGALGGCSLVLIWRVLQAPREQMPVMAGVALLGFALPFAYFRIRKGGLFGAEDTVKRGTTLAKASEVRKVVLSKTKNHRLSLGGVPVPRDAEPYHFLIAGATGTGKSVAINHVLQELRAANDTVILVDSGGDFMSKHFDASTDFVFNPFDDRCVNWSPLLEMQGEWDAEALARSMVPDGTGESKEWNSYAQTFVASVLKKLWALNRLNLQDLLYYILSAPTSELKGFLSGTPSAAQLASEKTFGSIRTIASNYLTAYSYLPGKGDAFSVSEMVQAEHSGFLFLTYRDDQLDSLRSLIGCILDVASRAILSLQPDPNRRIWLIIDEFASIGRVQSIEAVATKARKVGGCLLVGLQTVSQLRDRYGEHGAQTILSCLSSWLVLRCSDADTAEYMSKYVGDVELVRQTKSTNVSDSGDSQGRNEQQTTQRAVLPSEIQALPNLAGYLKLSGGLPLCEVTLDVKKLKNTTAHTASFVKRDTRAKPLVNFGVPSTGAVNAASSGPTSGPASATPASGASAPPSPVRTPVSAPARSSPPTPAQRPAPASSPAQPEIVKGVTVGLASPPAPPPPPPLRDTHVLLVRNNKD